MGLYVLIHNVSRPDTTEVCDYEWRAQINDRVLAQGLVVDHRREDGWIALLQRVVDDATKAAGSPCRTTG
jgi:hypothetical protein